MTPDEAAVKYAEGVVHLAWLRSQLEDLRAEVLARIEGEA